MAAEVRFQVDGPLDGPGNMSLDAEVLALAEQGLAAFRVYRWRGVWVSLGRFQSPEEALCDPEATQWVQRPTGGKAVLHGHDVTVGIAVPLASLGIHESRLLKGAYRLATAPLISALRDCGLPAILAEDTPFASRNGARGQTLAADCFAAVSPNDIVSESLGVKVCGCALRLTRTAVLVQASIPATQPEVTPSSLIRGGVSLPVLKWHHGDFPEALRKRMDSSFAESSILAV